MICLQCGHYTHPDREMGHEQGSDNCLCKCHPWNQIPSLEQLMEWEEEGGCQATDGCWVEADGICEHGCKSWLLELGII